MSPDMKVLALVLCVGFLSLSARAQESVSEDIPSRELNIRGFASCLAGVENDFDLDLIALRNGLGHGDLVLTYLSVYAGNSYPRPIQYFRDRAHARWAEAMEEQEAQLAQKLATVDERSILTPADMFREALGICGMKDIFCAALISHNVLRTIGRNQTAILRGRDLNPRWFKSNREFWINQSPRLAHAMISLRSAPGGERYGEWYHFFGLLTMSIREVIVLQMIKPVRAIAFISKILNPWVARGAEEPHKVRLDRDSISVASLYLKRRDLVRTGNAQCSTREAFAFTPASQ